MQILCILMFLVPPLFALMIHNYLRHGELEGRRKMLYLAAYAVLINACVYAASYVRGVRRIDMAHVTLSYCMKYMGLGCVLGLIVPFLMCLLTEEQITWGGLRRYSRRFINDVRRYLPYAVRAARADLRSEVANSYLNWMWWLIEPVCMMLIYTVIFGVVFKASEQYFPIFIFIGITMWSFFSRSISGSVNVVRASKGIITKIYMPKYILLLSKMFVNAFKMMVSFGVVLAMMLFYRVHITVGVLYFIPILCVLFLFTFGLGTILMHYGVYVNDLSYITGIVLSMLMYFTGTFYSIAKRIPAPFGDILQEGNPVAFLISAMRSSLLYGEAFSGKLLLLWGFVSLVMIALGAFTIYSNENSYVKVI